MTTSISGAGKRRKGNNFELKISKQLTAWANDPNVKFTRSPGSGSWVSSHGGLSGDIAGDIATEALWPFSMELKNHESFTSLDTIYHSQANIQSFWNQNLGDAVRVGKVPMLITHRNRSKAYATLPYSPIIHKDFLTNNLDYAIFNIRWHHGALDKDFNTEVITVVLEDLLTTYSYETLANNDKKMFSKWYANLDNLKELA